MVTTNADHKIDIINDLFAQYDQICVYIDIDDIDIDIDIDIVFPF